MANETCARCGTANDDGTSFCAECGASLEPQLHCPNCNALNTLGRKFCARCGGSLEHAGWGATDEPGAVIDGVWERGNDELIRRVEPEEARRFLGARTVRVPAGTVGVVLVDGVVDRILPPGERTSVSLFERIASFFLQRPRTAFYLVDQRPFVVPFVVRTRPSAGGNELRSQVLVTFRLPKGDREALAAFIANVMRDKASVSTGDLYNELRPEVARIAQDELERAAASGDISYPDAEASVRRHLAASLGSRYGLTVDATLAPLTAVTSVDLHLGTGAAPKVRPCVKCNHELPASLRFCDKCGESQPTVTVGGAPIDATTPLFTADGEQVELDLVVRTSGQRDDVSRATVSEAVVAAAAAALRTSNFSALTAQGGLAALEQAVSPAVATALQAKGLTLVAISVVDIRSKTGSWVLSARADLNRATEDLKLGLAWLEHRDNELELEQLTLTRVLRDQEQRRDHAFAQDSAALSDRERRDELAARQASLDVTKAQRDGATAAARDGVEYERRRRDVANATELRKTQVEAELAELSARRDLDFADLERRKKLDLELAAIAEQQQVEKLRAMAQIDRETSAQTHAHDLEKRAALRGLSPDEMIAAQAAELARSEGGGAAWAAALGSRADLERRHGDENRAVYGDAMKAMADVAKSRGEAAAVVAAPVVHVGTQAADGRACAKCGKGMKADAKFCGSCGTSA